MSSHEARIDRLLADIGEAISRIRDYTSGMDAPRFLTTHIVQDAVLWNLSVIGEASGMILRQAPSFAAENDPEIWRVAYNMRNRILHGYASINLGVVWRVTVEDLPALATRVTDLLKTRGH